MCRIFMLFCPHLGPKGFASSQASFGRDTDHHKRQEKGENQGIHQSPDSCRLERVREGGQTPDRCRIGRQWEEEGATE